MTAPMKDILQLENIHKRDNKGRNILFFKIKNKKSENVKHLIKQGVSLMVSPKKHALFHSIECDDFESVKYLVECGIDVNIRDREYKTPLMDAVYYGRLDICNFLLNEGADLFLMDIHEDMAIDFAKKTHRPIFEDVLNWRMSYEDSKLNIKGKNERF